jgi:hypothetical protein
MQVWAGLALILIGTALLLARLGIFDFLESYAQWFRQWWPLALILLGAAQLITRGRDAISPAGWLIFLGVLFLGVTLRFADWWRMHNLWPAFLIAAGVIGLLRRLGPAGGAGRAHLR